MHKSDHEDYDFLSANANIADSLGVPHFLHLDQPIGRWRYIRIANDICRQVPPGRLLDWGCGCGQMTYLLRRRGFQVTPFDIGGPDTKMPDIPMCHDLNVIRSMHPTNLPFESHSFDAVLSCGVLEHVDEQSQPGNEMKSLYEIARLLRPGGFLLMYQLPQRYALNEAIVRRFKLGYAHPRRYTEDEIRTMLLQTGYTIERVGRANLLSKNLTGTPPGLRKFYSRFSHVLIMADKMLCLLPGLNNLAGVLEVTARCKAKA